MADETYLAVDLGASGGRVLAGHFDGTRLRLEEMHRFENGPVRIQDSLHWDLLRLWSCVQDGLRVSASGSSHIRSVGVDTWGVDFGMLGRDDTLLGNPYHYRDARTTGMLQKADERVGKQQIFAETGLQFMELNSLYQLLAMQEVKSPILEAAETLLMVPDLFHWLLTGEKAVEQTNASTTQLYNPSERGWSVQLIKAFDLPEHVFGPIVLPGTKLGNLRGPVAEEVGLDSIDVVLPGTHDTASAVVAVPAASPVAAQPDWCYISSGTWSLMGVEVPGPIINDVCRGHNFTNEGGVGGTTRLLKNIAGMWLVQECRRIWAAEGTDYSWDELVEGARAAPAHQAVIDTDDPRLVAPARMPETICELCRETGQPVPENHGSIVRCALESLAVRYRQVVESLQEITRGKIDTIHIVGGGAQNELLSQMTADATARRVVAGPVEATAIGNVLVQAISAGELASIIEARALVRNSFDVQEYTPQDTSPWDELAARFAQGS